MELSRFPRVAEASAHGRFQPFHNDHLEYVLAAQSQCDFLWIGITKYDVTSTDLNPLGAVRERPENNPLTFFERVRMIREALIEAGVAAGSFGFVPFPIETPQRLHSFIGTSVPCYTTICEQWNRDKIDVLKAQGYEIRVLWERQIKKINGCGCAQRHHPRRDRLAVDGARSCRSRCRRSRSSKSAFEAQAARSD